MARPLAGRRQERVVPVVRTARANRLSGFRFLLSIVAPIRWAPLAASSGASLFSPQ